MNYSIVPPIVILYEGNDQIIHTDGHPFCDPSVNPDWQTCPCRQDEQAYLDAYTAGPEETTGTHAPNCRCPWCSAEEV